MPAPGSPVLGAGTADMSVTCSDHQEWDGGDEWFQRQGSVVGENSEYITTKEYPITQYTCCTRYLLNKVTSYFHLIILVTMGYQEREK